MEKIPEILQNQFNILASLINSDIPLENFSGLRKSLEAYSCYIKKFNLELKAEIKIKSSFCTFCNEPMKNKNINKSVVLNCKHVVCSNECIKK